MRCRKTLSKAGSYQGAAWHAIVPSDVSGLQSFLILPAVSLYSRDFATLTGEEVLARDATRPAPAPLPL
jgi:hypothetical protein